MTDVFISYKRRLRPKVEQLAERLEALGVDVWFDAELESGSTFSATISHEVRHAKCVLVCWSNDAFPHGGDRHGWVIGEATIGRDRDVLVAAFLEKSDLDPPWNTVHADDLTRVGEKNWEIDSGWRSVLLAIGKRVGRPGLADYVRASRAADHEALTLWAERYPSDPLAPPLLAAKKEREEAAAAELRQRQTLLQNAHVRRGTGGRTVFLSLALVGVALAGYFVWSGGLTYVGGPQFGPPTSGTAKATSQPFPYPGEAAPSEQRTAANETSPSAASSQAATPAVTADQGVSANGTRALLIEAPQGSSPRRTFEGHVSWRIGVDEIGQPTLAGDVTIPSRGLSLAFSMEKNADKAVMASHVLDLAFSVPERFSEGSIAGISSILPKREELIPGDPLVGASARLEGNSFIFALSNVRSDREANTKLLSRDWFDIAIVYASGRRAILTLDKGGSAKNLFQSAFSTWEQSPYLVSGKAVITGAQLSTYAQSIAARDTGSVEESAASNDTRVAAKGDKASGFEYVGVWSSATSSCGNVDKSGEDRFAVITRATFREGSRTFYGNFGGLDHNKLRIVARDGGATRVANLAMLSVDRMSIDGQPYIRCFLSGDVELNDAIPDQPQDTEVADHQAAEKAAAEEAAKRAAAESAADAMARSELPPPIDLGL